VPSNHQLFLGLDQRSYSTPGPISAWTGEPPWRRTRHPGLLSLSHPSAGKRNEYPAKAGENTGTSRDTLAFVLGLAALGWWLAEGLV